MKALHIAAAIGHLDIMQLLIDAGANVNHQRHNRETPVRTVLIADSTLASARLAAGACFVSKGSVEQRGSMR